MVRNSTLLNTPPHEKVALSAWLNVIEQTIGFVLPKNLHHHLNFAINQTARAQNLSINSLFERIKYDELVRQQLINQVVIEQSRFFRDEKAMQFVADYFGRYALDISFLSQTDVFNIVSMGCSYGQEAYSLAMACQNMCDASSGAKKMPQYRIIGLDVSTKALDIATHAVYSNSALPQIAPDYLKYITSYDDGFMVNESIKKHVQFAHCNIFENDAPVKSLQPFDAPVRVIVCQNMLIYFRRFDQRDILNRLSMILPLGGMLILAAGEGLFWQNPNMQRIKNNAINAWQKIC